MRRTCRRLHGVEISARRERAIRESGARLAGYVVKFAGQEKSGETLTTRVSLRVDKCRQETKSPTWGAVWVERY